MNNNKIGRPFKLTKKIYWISYDCTLSFLYDSSKAYIILKSIGIIPIIKPRKNARLGKGSPERSKSIGVLKTLGDKEWSKIMNYGNRWNVEIAFSIFKHLYGEYCTSKKRKIYLRN
jgi:hypothetical protein